MYNESQLRRAKHYLSVGYFRHFKLEDKHHLEQLKAYLQNPAPESGSQDLLIKNQSIDCILDLLWRFEKQFDDTLNILGDDCRDWSQVSLSVDDLKRACIDLIDMCLERFRQGRVLSIAEDDRIALRQSWLNFLQKSSEAIQSFRAVEERLLWLASTDVGYQAALDNIIGSFQTLRAYELEELRELVEYSELSVNAVDIYADLKATFTKALTSLLGWKISQFGSTNEMLIEFIEARTIWVLIGNDRDRHDMVPIFIRHLVAQQAAHFGATQLAEPEEFLQVKLTLSAVSFFVIHDPELCRKLLETSHSILASMLIVSEGLRNEVSLLQKQISLLNEQALVNHCLLIERQMAASSSRITMCHYKMQVLASYKSSQTANYVRHLNVITLEFLHNYDKAMEEMNLALAKIANSLLDDQQSGKPFNFDLLEAYHIKSKELLALYDKMNEHLLGLTGQWEMAAIADRLNKMVMELSFFIHHEFNLSIKEHASDGEVSYYFDSEDQAIDGYYKFAKLLLRVLPYAGISTQKKWADVFNQLHHALVRRGYEQKVYIAHFIINSIKKAELPIYDKINKDIFRVLHALADRVDITLSAAIHQKEKKNYLSSLSFFESCQQELLKTKFIGNNNITWFAPIFLATYQKIYQLNQRAAFAFYLSGQFEVKKLADLETFLSRHQDKIAAVRHSLHSIQFELVPSSADSEVTIAIRQQLLEHLKHAFNISAKVTDTIRTPDNQLLVFELALPSFTRYFLGSLFKNNPSIRYEEIDQDVLMQSHSPGT